MWGITVTGIFFLAVLAVVAFNQGATVLGLADALAACLLVVVLLFLRFTGCYEPCCKAGVSIAYVLFLYIFVTGGVNSTGFMWYYAFPLLSLFLLGARWGTGFTLALFVPSVGFLAYDLSSTAVDVYDGTFAMRFVPSFITVSIFAYLSEISRARSHEALQRAYTSQEAVIGKRTAQLQHEVEVCEEYSRRLQRTERMEAIGLMASGVAHDLNNIFSGIINYPELMLLDLPENSDLRRPLGAIKNSGMRAAAVVADLLTVARGVACERSSWNLNQLINAYLSSPEHDELAERFPDVVFVSRLAKEATTILCAPVQIVKCLTNLVANAAEAIESTGIVTLTTRTEHIDAERAAELSLERGEHIVLEIADTGSGISPEDREHVFERFYTSKALGRSGTGLGLAVVWNTITEHEGSLQVDSGEDGSVFRAFLPAGESPESADEVEHTSLEDLGGHGELVLVVDDEAVQRELASMMLTRLGYRSDVVASGEACVEYIRTIGADAVLLDVALGPGINGKEALERLREIRPDQRVILVSGYAEDREVTEALSLGACCFMGKPYTIEDLGRRLVSCLGRC